MQKATIVVLDAVGFSHSAIAQWIGRDARTVEHWVNHWNQHGSVEDEERTGRPRLTDAATDQTIVSFAQQTPITTPKIIRRELQLGVSARTTRRRLDEAGLFGRVARVEYPYQQIHLDQRLAFAQEHQRWNERDWARVLFSDETHIILGQHGQIWVQRPEDAAFVAVYMADRDPFPQKLSIWGCFSAKGVGSIVVFDSAMNAAQLLHIFKQHLIQDARRFWPRQRWKFLQDNAPYHRSKVVLDWLEEQKVDLIKLPPYSPDLNPIENLWANLKTRIEARNPSNIEDLKKFLLEEWSNTPLIYCRHLALSMIDRCTLVEENDGFKTPY
jgi:transposase